MLCKVRLVGAWIKKREVVNEVRRIRSEELTYVRCLENKMVEWDEESTIEHIW